MFAISIGFSVESDTDFAQDMQKQPSRDVLRKKCYENMQQIYRRIPMPKCDLLKSHFGVSFL